MILTQEFRHWLRGMTLILQEIREKLSQSFEVIYIDLIDESHLHANHREGSADGGTHFRLLIVSPDFDDCNRLKRHRMVYDVLSSELSDYIHALVIKAVTPEEYKLMI